MILVVQRRVPEGHHRIAHIFIDGAAVIECHLGHRGQEPVHQTGKPLRVIFFGDRGKAAEIGEQQRQFAGFAAEPKLGRVVRQTLHHVRRHVMAEGLADMFSFMFGAQIGHQGRPEINHHTGDGRINRIQQKAFVDEEIPGQTQGAGQHAGGDGRAKARAKAGGGDGHHQADQKQHRQLRALGPVRPLQKLAGQYLFDHLKLRLGTGHCGGQRGRVQILQPGGADAHDNDISGDETGLEFARHDPPGRNPAFGHRP